MLQSSVLLTLSNSFMNALKYSFYSLELMRTTRANCSTIYQPKRHYVWSVATFLRICAWEQTAFPACTADVICLLISNLQFSPPVPNWSKLSLEYRELTVQKADRSVLADRPKMNKPTYFTQMRYSSLGQQLKPPPNWPGHANNGKRTENCCRSFLLHATRV